MPKTKDVGAANKPNWLPEAGNKKQRAEWLHEWVTLQEPEVQEREKRRRSPCCMDLVGGRYTGTRRENNMRYEKTCTNCDKVLYSKRIWEAAGDDFAGAAQDLKAKAANGDVPF